MKNTRYTENLWVRAILAFTLLFAATAVRLSWPDAIEADRPLSKAERVERLNADADVRRRAAKIADAPASKADQHPPFPEIPEVQRQLADTRRANRARNARRRTAAAKTQRRRSRSSHKHRDRGQSARLARSEFPSLFSAEDRRALPLKRGQRVVRYTGPNSALVKTNGEREGTSVVESTTPLRARDEQGDVEPVDLELERRSYGWEPRNPSRPVTLGERADRALTIPGTVAIGFASSRAIGARMANEIFFGEVAQDTDAWFGPMAGGARAAFQLRSAASPEDLRLRFKLDPGVTLRRSDNTVELLRDGDVVGGMSAPAAFDADDEPIPAGLRVEGSDVVVEVRHRDKDARYPIAIDPAYEGQDSWRYGNTNRAGWRYYENYPAFPHCFVPTECSWGPDGSGFYISRRTSDPVVYSDWFAEYQYLAPNANSFIHQADFLYIRHSGFWTNTTQGMWSRNRGRFSHNYTTWQDLNYIHRVVCADGYVSGAHCDQSPSDLHGANNNYVQSSISPNATGPQYNDRDAYMYFGGARIWMSDANNPAPTYFEGLPAGWVRDVPARGFSGANQQIVRFDDAGLGMKSVSLDVPGRARQTVTHGCGGGHSSRCPAYLVGLFSLEGISEGIQTIWATATDATQRSGAHHGTVKVDRTGPEDVTASGGLKNLENKSLYAATSTVQSSPRDGSAASPRSGVARTELLVDGQVHDSVAESCPNGQCPHAPGEKTLTLSADQVPDGERSIAVRAIDLAGNTTTSASWKVTVDRRGDVYSANEYDAAPSDGGELVARENAQIGTRNARRTEDQDVSTRGTVPCSQNPAASCGQTRHLMQPEQGDEAQDKKFSTYRGTSVGDRRLQTVAAILEPANAELGTPTRTGPLGDVVGAWQTPPPSHGSTYALYERPEGVTVDGQATEAIRRLWIDVTTKMPIREQTVVGGELEAESFYSYDKERRTTSELPGDVFAVTRPVDATTGEDVDYATGSRLPPGQGSGETEAERIAEAREFRSEFGLNTNEAHIRATLNDPSLVPTIDLYGVPLTASEDAEMDERDRAAEAMDAIDEYGATQASGSYAGTYIDQDDGGLVYVRFTSNASQHLNALKATFPYPERLRALDATLTLPALQSLADRLLGDIQSLISQGLNIASIEPDEAENAIVVGAVNPTAAWQQLFSSIYGSSVRLVQQAIPQSEQVPLPPDAGDERRIFWTIPPVFGGINIASQGGHCSSGFSARRGRTRFRVMTAGHCAPRGAQFAHYVGSREQHQQVPIGQVIARDWRDRGNADAELIGITRAFATRRLLVNPMAPNEPARYRIVNRAARFRTGQVRDREHVGTRLCIVGYRHARPRCGRLTQQDVTVRQLHTDGIVREFRHQHRGSFRSRPGDSGSAVYSPRRGRTTAYGIFHTAGGRFTPISTLLEQWNLTLVGVG